MEWAGCIYQYEQNEFRNQTLFKQVLTKCHFSRDDPYFTCKFKKFVFLKV